MKAEKKKGTGVKVKACLLHAFRRMALLELPPASCALRRMHGDDILQSAKHVVSRRSTFETLNSAVACSPCAP